MFVAVDEKEALIELIDTFYRSAGESGWTGDINDSVAKVFLQMLLEAQKGLKDYSWSILVPEEKDITAKWLIYQIDNYTIEKMGRMNQETSCLEFALEKWDDRLRLASKYDVLLDEDEDD
ncbi:MAG: hypothetical protein OEY52_07810 [Gammaproteobacteria bacterium]|nr:hypothetical protein [Gammaproteobacteria bacterium]